MPAPHVASRRGPDLGDGPSPLNPSDRAFWVGLSVVVLSLISAFATYLILTGLTPIPPRNEVVLVVLFVNVVLIGAMFGLHRVADVGPCACVAREDPRRALAHSHRAAVQHHRRAADAPARRGRHRDVLALARRLVLDAYARDRLQLARRCERLSRRARPGHPHRYRQYGARSGRGRRLRRRRSRQAAAHSSWCRLACAICPPPTSSTRTASRR